MKYDVYVRIGLEITVQVEADSFNTAERVVSERGVGKLLGLKSPKSFDLNDSEIKVVGVHSSEVGDLLP